MKWTTEELKSLKREVKKATSVSAGIKVYAEKSGRNEKSIAAKWYTMAKKKGMKKRKYTKSSPTLAIPERINVSKGLTFDIQNIKRATLSGNNTLTLFF